MKISGRISFTLLYIISMTFVLISLITFNGNFWKKNINNILTASNKISARLKGPLLPSDPNLVSYINKNYLFPPSTKAYNLRGNHTNYIALYSYRFISSVIQQLFHDKSGGFFVEAGALDGEILSNTLELETKKQWTGLLVEPNKEMLPKLRGKNRKAWITPTCLGVKRYPYSTILTKFDPSVFNEKNSYPYGNAGSSKIMDKIMDSFTSGFTNYEIVQCLPIESLLLALGVTKIDFFSLDIENMEKEVLESFPFHLFQVDVWIVEHIPRYIPPKDEKFWSEKVDGSYFTPDIMKKYNVSINVDVDLIEFMESKGYYFFDMFCGGIADLAFVSIKSDIYKRLKVPEDQIKRRNLCDDKKIILSQPEMDSLNTGDLRDKTHWPQVEFRKS